MYSLLGNSHTSDCLCRDLVEIWLRIIPHELSSPKNGAQQKFKLSIIDQKHNANTMNLSLLLGKLTISLRKLPGLPEDRWSLRGRSSRVIELRAEFLLKDVIEVIIIRKPDYFPQITIMVT